MVLPLYSFGKLYDGEVPRSGELAGFATLEELSGLAETPVGGGFGLLVAS